MNEKAGENFKKWLYISDIMRKYRIEYRKPIKDKVKLKKYGKILKNNFSIVESVLETLGFNQKRRPKMEKYLNSVEEVVKALEEGKKILDIANMDCYYKVIAEKYCYCDLKNNTTVINISIVFEDNSKRYYTEEPEQLKFEVNRAYKVECGKKVFIDSDFKEDKKYRVFFENGFYFIDYNGKNCLSNTKWNIVGYWEEEK